MLLPCPFHVLTGYDCPFCGAQRMLLALLHGDIVAAFWFNPVLFCMLPYFAIVLVGAFSKTVKEWRVTKLFGSNRAIFTVILLFCVWGVIRNII